MMVPSFFKTLRRLTCDLSFEINSFTLDIPWISVILERVKSRIIFSDCLLASRKLFCTVCFPPPVGDFSSQRILVFNTYRSGVLLEYRRIKIRLLWKCCAKSSAVSRSCWRGFEPPTLFICYLKFCHNDIILSENNRSKARTAWYFLEMIYTLRRARFICDSTQTPRDRFRRHFWYKMAWEKLPISRGFFFISAPILMISVLLRIELGHSTKRPIWQPEYTWLRYLSRALGRVWQIHPLKFARYVCDNKSRESAKYQN